MTQSPSVAVIIAAYRAQGVVGRAVRSALAQPETRQVVVAVDACPENTAAAARAADDGSGRLLVLEEKTNRGPAGARNAALAHAGGRWVTVLDADDFLEPGRFARLLNYAVGQDFVADDLLLVPEGGEDGPRTPMWFTGPAAPVTLDLERFVAANLPRPGGGARRELGFLKPLMRHAFLQDHGLRYEETLRLGEDFHLYARALAAGARFLLTPAQGYVAVRRPDSLSGAHTTRDLKALRDAVAALAAAPDLAPEARRALRRHQRFTDKKYQWRRLIEAVKARAPGEAAACFTRHPAVSAYLAGQLLDQARLRVANGVRR